MPLSQLVLPSFTLVLSDSVTLRDFQRAQNREIHIPVHAPSSDEEFMVGRVHSVHFPVTEAFHVPPTAYDWPPWHGPSVIFHHVSMHLLSGKPFFQCICRTFLLTSYLFRIKTPRPCLVTRTTRNLLQMDISGFVFLKLECVSFSSYRSDAWKWFCWRSKASEGGSSPPDFSPLDRLYFRR